MKPTKATIHKFIGKKVRIIFYEGDILEGVLKIGDTNNWWQKNKYNINDWWFRVSHIKNIGEVKE